MRILLGECVNPRLDWAFTGHEVQTVVEMGWGGINSASYSRWLSSSLMCLSPPREARRMLSPVASSPIPGFIRFGGLALPLFSRGGFRVRLHYSSRGHLAGLRLSGLLLHTPVWLHVERVIHMMISVSDH